MDANLNQVPPTSLSEPNQESYQLEKTEERDDLQVKAKTVVLYGSGDMAIALAMNLLRTKHHPIIASRNPERARNGLKMKNLDIDVMSIHEAIPKGDLIIVAIPSEHHPSLPREVLKNKILIDISNRSPSASSGKLSLGEHLQEMFPDGHVVKAFNTLSAYALTHGFQQRSKEVPICGDEKWACDRVASLVRELGFTPVEYGALSNARAIEDMPLSFFPEWKIPLLLCLGFFSFNWIITLFRKQLCYNFESGVVWDWSSFNKLPLNNSQMSLAFTAASLLLLTYIPGTFAAYIQLYRGTKYSQFPGWLDKWLKSRKQIGLLALLLGTTHGCAAIFAKMPDELTESWKEQIFLMSGPILAALLAILGVTSLPSVSAQLTWREFSFVQRYLGWFAVFFLFLHGLFCNWDDLKEKPRCVVIPNLGQIFVVECMITFLLKIPLLIPCVGSYLMKIRNGYERPPSRTSPTRDTHHVNIAFDKSS